MNEKFFDLSREKQDRMINGALEIFAKNGYRHASTDDMVKAVGISKGLWFHYFGSKEGIYVFVYDYCAKYMLLELSTIIDETRKDYFERIRQIALTKTRVYRNYPYLEMFLDRAAQETEETVAAQIAESRQIYETRIENLLRTTEIESVSDKMRREQIKKILDYSIKGIFIESIQQKIDSENVYREIQAYIELMKDMTQNLP